MYVKSCKRNILLVLKTPPPYGGGEIRAAALRNHVANMNEFIVLEFGSPMRDKASQGMFAIWKLTEFLKNWFMFARMLRKKKPRLVFYPLSKSFPHFLRDSVFLWTAWLFRIPCAGELAGATFYFLKKGRLRAWYGRIVLSRLVCLRLLGKSIAAELKKSGITNTIVTDNGIETGVLDQSFSEPDDGCFHLLFAGTHSREKGFDVLVYACRDLMQQGLNFKMHTMGQWVSNEFKDEMISEIHSAKLKDNFVFHGLIHDTDKWNLFSNSQILVLPSKKEGQPLVILEAFSVGMPVVATRVGAIPDTLEQGKNGLLVTPGDASDLANSIAELLLNSDLCRRISTANSELYQRRFTLDSFLKTQVAWIKACADNQMSPAGQIWSETDFNN